MKLVFVLVSITLMAFTCRKSGEPIHSKDNQLVGKWRNISSWINPGGGPDQTHTPASNDLFIDFQTNGVFSSNLPAYDFDSYKIGNDQRVAFTKSSNGNNLTAVISLVADTLRLSSLGCIEGCGHSFVPYK